MTDLEKIKMFLNIGDQRFSMTVPFAKQDFVRDVESEVDGLYRKWRLSFPSKSDKEILAMVAYQYASFYNELKTQYAEAARKATECLELAQNATESPALD